MSTSSFSPSTIIGSSVIDELGDKVGTVGSVFLDSSSFEPTWITVSGTGSGLKESFVPLSGSRLSGSDLHIPFEKRVVVDAPSIDSRSDVSSEVVERIFDYYGVELSKDDMDVAKASSSSSRLVRFSEGSESSSVDVSVDVTRVESSSESTRS